MRFDLQSAAECCALFLCQKPKKNHKKEHRNLVFVTKIPTFELLKERTQTHTKPTP